MTAVEWAIQYLNNVKPNEFCSIETIKEVLQQALKMEKQQHEQTFEAGYGVLYTSFEQYYNETFKIDNL